MKITFILPSLNFSGGVKVVKQYTEKLREFGHDCQIYYPTHSAVIGAPGRLPNFNKDNLPYAHSFWGDWRIPESDVVIATTQETAQYVAKLEESKGRKVYFIQHYEQWAYLDTFRYYPEVDLYRFDGLKKSLEVDKTYCLPMQHIYVSDFIQTFIPSHNSGNTVHNGISVPQMIHKDYSTPNILFPYRSQRWKGFETFWPVIQKIRRDYPKIKMIGYGFEPPKVGNFPFDDDFPFFMYYKPSDAILGELYNNANIFVFPSWIEGFGLPPLEAAAHGCAVVCTKTNAMPELFRKEDMLWCNPQDSQCLENKLRDLIEHEFWREDIGKRAQRHARYFMLDRAARNFEKAIS